MKPGSERWVEVAPSAYEHERAGLARVRDLLPDADPYRAWSNFELITDRGESLEVDLLVLGPAGLYLVELKSWSGRLRGDRYRWVLDGPKGRRVTDNPFLGANRKARILKTLVERAARHVTQRDKRLPRVDEIVPWVQAAILLHGPEIVCQLSPDDRVNVFGLDEDAESTNLPGLVKTLLTREPDDPARRIATAQSRILGRLFETSIGFTRRRVRRVGSYDLRDKPIDEGPSWQDYLADHHRLRGEVRRVRVYYVGRATTDEERATIERAAEREFRLLRHLEYPGLLAPVEYHETSDGPSLVYPYDEDEAALDNFLAAHGAELDITDRLSIIRAVAETLRYAHSRHITHRGLSPRSVLVRRAENSFAVRIADWQTGARTGASQSSSPDGILAGTRHIDSFLDPRTLAYQSPEHALGTSEDEVRMDVFGAGAIAYLVLSGEAPAANPIALRQRLAAERGLDLAADVASIPEHQRALVLDATRGEVAQRTATMDDFIKQLAGVEKDNAGPPTDENVDPLEAQPETELADRWRVVRRLGSGSSAVALLVEDLAYPSEPAVLKVARNADRADRLRDECEVLSRLDDPRIVKLRVTEPVDIGDRTAIALEYAGDATLAVLLRRSGRLSLDLLERYGDDLLGAAAYLDANAINHRDIKPDNLGIRPRASDRQPHLLLYDFSLSRAPLTDIRAGTPPYLDPFLGSVGRLRWDAAAERYAVAVTLFEMATGRTPVYGDGQSDPTMIADEATVEPGMFDAAVAEPLTRLFCRALRRDARERFGSVDEMHRAWMDAVRGATERATPPDADGLALRATRDTPLSEAGLSPRALSALEPLRLRTVGDMLAVPAFNLSRLRGSNEATRREIRARAKAWRERLASASAVSQTPETQALASRSVDAVVSRLVPGNTGRNGTEIHAARLLLGLEHPAPGGVVDWLTQGDLAERLEVTRVRAQQIDASLRARWAKNVDVLGPVRDDIAELVGTQGGVATSAELARALLALRGSSSEEPDRTARSAGLVRAAVEAELEQGGGARLDRGRRGGLVYVGLEPPPDSPGPAASDLIDYAAALARAAEALEAEPDTPLSTARAVEQLRRVDRPPAMTLLDSSRFLRLAAARREPWAVSARDELYPVGMSAVAALRYSGAGFGPRYETLSEEALRERVRARYPDAQPLPQRPALDQLLEQTGSPLRWDSTVSAFAAPTDVPSTISTFVSGSSGAREDRPGRWREIDRRLRDARDEGSFLALGARPGSLDTLPERLARVYDVSTVNLRTRLLAVMRVLAERYGVPWDEVLRADAAPRGTQASEGLQNLVQQAVDQVEHEVRKQPEPVLLTDGGLLARFGHLSFFARLADHTTLRPTATWLVVPVLGGGDVPVLEQQPLPVLSSQWLLLPLGWRPEERSDQREGVLM